MSYQPGYKEAKEAVAEGNAADDDALVEWMKLRGCLVVLF
jgi:hypothetical protein